MDFNQAIWPLLYFFKLYGFAPYTRVKNANSKCSYQTSKPALVYSFMFSSVGIAIPISTLVVINRITDSNEEVTFIYVSRILRVICNYLLYVYAHAMCFTNRHQILDIIEKMSKLADILEISRKSFRKYVTISVWQIIFNLIISFAPWVSIIILHWKTPYAWIYVGLNNMLYFVSLMIPLMQFSNASLILAQLFHALTAKLVKYEIEPSLFRRGSLPTNIPIRGCWQSKDGIVPFWTSRSKNHPNLGVGDEGSMDPIQPEEDIDQNQEWFERFDASNIHSALYDIAEQINSLFGFQNLLSLFVIYLQILYGVFSCIQMSPNATNNPYNFFSNLLKIVNCSARLIFLVYCCNSLTSQEKLLTYTVSKLQTNASSAHVRKQMQTLSLQLLHRKIELSACGLFPIDATLVHGVAVGVTTYLVILIEYAN